MSGILLVVGKHETASQSIGCGVVSWEIRSAGTSLLNSPSSFSRFHSQKPRTNLPSCIQIPIALSFADVPGAVPSLLCFTITGPVKEIQQLQESAGGCGVRIPDEQVL